MLNKKIKFKVMKRRPIVYGILLCLILFHISCKKEDTIVVNNSNTNNLINNTLYSATAQFTKEYYLSSPYYTDATTTISVKIADLNNNTPISDKEYVQILIFSDPKFTNLLIVAPIPTTSSSGWAAITKIFLFFI